MSVYIDDISDNSYLENGLPNFLEKSLLQWKNTMRLIEKDERPSTWDLDFCELQSDINVAEVDEQISSRQAWYLREKYLGINRNNM